MAVKRGVTFDTIMADLRARKFAPVYLLMGEESYYIDKLSDYIAKNVLAPEERDFNQSIVFGADVTTAQVADMARRYPMMSEFQVVIVKEAQNLKGFEPLEKYLENPVNSTILVLCYKNGTVDRRKKIISKVNEVGVVFESSKLKDRDLVPFIEKYAREHQASIENKAAHMMADYIGADLNRLSSELDKVLLSLSESDRRITPDIIEKEVGVSKEFNGYELRDAIIRRDIFKANQIIKYFDSNPKAGSIYSFLPMLFNYFKKLMIALYAPNKSSDDALAKFLELKSTWGAKDYMTGMRNYSAMKVMQIIYKIREIDAKSKGLDNPNTGAGDLMKELIFFILH